MHFLLDKKSKKRIYFIFGAIGFVLILLFVFGKSIFPFLSSSTRNVANSSISVANELKDNVVLSSLLLRSKKGLAKELINLQKENTNFVGINEKLGALQKENEELKEIFSRSISKDLILSAVVAKPNRSLYDTLLLDVGTRDGISIGDKVYVNGNILVGSMDSVNEKTSIASLFSTPGREFDALFVDSDVTVPITGHGNSSFRVDFPRDFPLEIGSLVVFPDMRTTVIGTVREIKGDPRDPTKTVFIESPVNIQKIRWVQILPSN